ncbi:spermatogenesis-associated protein 5-like protein 1 [Lingula anatina]|uniref:Spermatogenesis-associated protein 5-like protein 1 n=1 Tax=Lingula anatina TaxID=7574 RepID=A0A1S3JBH6_LINAN|nr:spermatogenesis-associated protein 5-like protein 1 [Lingula anatina]XP_013407666.1 spermatogenesis-associated protein 5-like protein 1 [Lingula anatina]XP_013407674.1 spermatogenesis-associated protein 5-like protein 1 [Lingula anatina]XP_013407683.1 spermatogenesis-associated protein 5-like protein 1 [Lingula anatina]|eukprot:XP_013407658.1 spermatogenesis-associated protein 5-like protein 1 [Lingula anatina]
MDHLIVLPLDVFDMHSQRCRLGPLLMSRLGVSLGNCVKIWWKNQCHLSIAWPREDCHEKFLQVDGFVTSVQPDAQAEKLNDMENNQITVFKHVKQFSAVYLNVVMTDLDFVLKLNENPNMKKGYLISKCRCLLNNLYVAANFKVDFTEHTLGKLYGISYIEIATALPDNLEVGRVLTVTDIEIKKVISKRRYDYCQKRTSDMSSIGGLEQEAKKLREIISLPFQYQQQVENVRLELPKGVLLSGPPGTGKTSLVRAICSEYAVVLLHINGPELTGPRPGESEENLRKSFKEAINLSKEGPTVLFIDEIDSLCPRQSKSGQQDGRMLGQLLTLMDGLQSRERLVVLAATNRASAVDPSLRRSGRFDQEFFIGIPSESQRRQILSVHTKSLLLGECVNLDRLADMTKGYVGADLACICNEAAYSSMARCKCLLKVERINPEPVTMLDFTTSIHNITPSTQKGSDILVDGKPVLWEQIGGLQTVKLQLKQSVEWPLQHPEAFSRLGLPLPKGVLLYGPPGCSKTMLVKAAATACGATFLSVSGAQLYSPFVGDSEKALSEAFSRARMGAPSILFLDEIDSIIGKRSESSTNRSVQERVLSVLLNEMDGVGIKVEEKTTRSGGKERLLEGVPSWSQAEFSEVDNSHVLVVAATNRPDMLDEALLRPGRFDRIIYVPPPGLEAREEIIRIHSRHMPKTDVDVRWLAEQTAGFTGADLENLCREASLHALSERGLDVEVITQQDFAGVLANLKPSVTSSQLEQYSILNWRTKTNKE